MTDCAQNRDPLKLVHDGTSQEQRFPAALDPAYAPVDEQQPEQRIVFAQAYAAFLNYFDANNVAVGDWVPFFSEDVSAQLAVVGVQDVTYYRQQVREYLDFLNDRQHAGDEQGMRDHLDYLFSCVATLAIGFDRMIKNLPEEIGLQKSLQNLIRSQLAPALERLIAYHKGGAGINDGEEPLNESVDEQAAPLIILGERAVMFSTLSTAVLAEVWTDGTEWATHYSDILADVSVYGNLTTTAVFDRVNHLATHNLFTSILDQFLKVYARAVSDAQAQLADTYTEWNRHEPHYALFLAFLRLLEHARAEANTLTGRHLDFYYRDILQLKEKTAVPSNAHLLVELAKRTPAHLIEAGELFKAGKDDLGNNVFFANDRDIVLNQAQVTDLMTVYRHDDEKLAQALPTENHEGRVYTSPIANSDDGLGTELTTADQSWHPFHNKVYENGKLQSINMPPAEIGFAIASHYLLMAEGMRTITVTMYMVGSLEPDLAAHVTCLLTSEEGWLEKTAVHFKTESEKLELQIKIDGADTAVTPYVPATHGYTFDTDLPILLVKLKHDKNAPYPYSLLKDIKISNIELKVEVEGLKTLAVSNDFGPVDTSKPFQPYGASPVANSVFIIGSKELFQKELTSAGVNIAWMLPPAPYLGPPTQTVLELFQFIGQPYINLPLVASSTDSTTVPVKVSIDYLKSGQWQPSDIPTIDVATTNYSLTKNLHWLVVDEPDFTPNEFYNTTSRHGFIRLKLTRDFGQNAYQTDLINFLREVPDAEHPGDPPVGPSINALSIGYSASQTITLNSDTGFEQRQARFFHQAPFGQAEQHPVLTGDSNVYLVPQFDSESEFYIGIIDLKPPQNLSLLFQVVDGTADPLTQKPPQHIQWSYLSSNQWLPFATNDVEDHTGGLLNSGIITFSLPREASATNTLLPADRHWIRAAVAAESDAVCRLITVAAQALEATFTDQQNDPTFAAKVLEPGTISKLAQPKTAVKKITQPFPTIGGRGAEQPSAFYTRVSERLRHKDRAIALWDYERLVLEAFPQIYKAKCLNHTHYEPTESGGIYKELAPGHVTIVTIPDLSFPDLRNPLRPYTSLGLLGEIEVFLRQRLSCFVTLHVKNPQFEDVYVAFKVQLYDGFDESFYTKQLKEEITGFLSPWAFPEGGSPSFGGKIYKSVLINFVEERPYVDYVTDFELFHVFKDSDGNQQTIETDEVVGSKAVSILVSVPASDHQIESIQE